jgi:hypothetical protein
MTAPYAISFVRDAALSQKDECIIWPFSQDGRGYGQVVFQGAHMGPHRAVCILTHGAPPADRKYEAAHSCHNKLCVNPRHVRWATHSENQLDRREAGNSNLGERHGKSKLQELDVLCILGSADSYKVIAARHQISVSCVGLIKQGKRWPHIYRRFQEMQAKK